MFSPPRKMMQNHKNGIFANLGLKKSKKISICIHLMHNALNNTTEKRLKKVCKIFGG